MKYHIIKSDSPDLPKAVEGLLCYQGCLKLDKLTIQISKDCVTGKGKDGNFVQIKTLHFLIIKFKSIFVWLRQSSAMQSSVCCIAKEIRLYYWELNCRNHIVQKSIF